MTAIAQALSTALLHFVWEGSMVSLGLAVFLFVFRSRTARVRYVACCVALGVSAGLPLLTALLVYDPALPGDFIGADPFVATVNPAPGMTWLGLWQAWALPIWAFGVLFVSIRFMSAWSYVSALRRNAVELSDSARMIVSDIRERLGIGSSIRILKSSMADAPSVIGWVRPIILLPCSALSGLTPVQLEAILAHELAHIRRHDYFINVLQMVVETVLFYHPAVWWISGRIRHERELCCGDMVVQVCGDPVVYARALTELEKLRQTRVSLAVGSAGGPLLRRVQRLTGQAVPEYTWSWLPAAAAISVMVITMTLNISSSTGAEMSAPISAPERLASLAQGPTQPSTEPVRTAAQAPEQTNPPRLSPSQRSDCTSSCSSPGAFEFHGPGRAGGAIHCGSGCSESAAGRRSHWSGDWRANSESDQGTGCCHIGIIRRGHHQ